MTRSLTCIFRQLDKSNSISSHTLADILTSTSADWCLMCLMSSTRSSKNPVWAKRRRNWEELAVQFNKWLLSVDRHSISNPVLTRAKGGNSVMYVLPMSRIIWRENWTQRSTKPTATAKRKKSSSWSSTNWRSLYIPILCRCWYSCLYAWGFSVSRSRKLMMFLKSAQSFGHFWYSLQIVCKSSGDISWDPAIIIIITLMCTTLKKKNSRRATACVKNSLDWEKEKNQSSLHTKMTTITGRPTSYRPTFHASDSLGSMGVENCDYLSVLVRIIHFSGSVVLKWTKISSF